MIEHDRAVGNDALSSAADGAIESPEGVALAVRGVSKVFPGTTALDHVNLTLRRGEIHALCGGNGSGKSTLIKILSGVTAADGGHVTINGRELDATDIRPKTVRESGLRVVHQDLAIFPDLSVAENMMLGSVYPINRMGGIHWSKVKQMAKDQIDRFDIPAAPGTRLGSLPVATRTQVAIARALHDVDTSTGILILDEPTASLPAGEVDDLHRALRRLASQGLAIILVSHRLDEVLDLSDRITVLRDGKLHSEMSTEGLVEADLIDAMLGRAVEEAQTHRPVTARGELVLSVSDLDAGPLRNVHVDVHAGEVVGVVGLVGSGRTELLQAICGVLPRSAGSVSLQGAPVEFRRLDQAIKKGVVLIPEDRTHGGVFPQLSVDDNLNISVLRRYWSLLGFNGRKLRRDSAHLRSRFRVKAPDGGAPMSTLSGGNQQKVVLGRWLRRDPILLLLDEPTQGVDVGARADIHALLRETTDAGGAALLVTSDLEEMALSVDRAIVLRRGRVVGEVSRQDLSAHRLTEVLHTEGRTISDVARH